MHRNTEWYFDFMWTIQHMLCRVLSNQQFINHINQHTDETFCLQVGVHKTPGHPSGLKPFDITECIRHLTRITYKGDGIVVRVLISHHYVGQVCWWLMFCSKGFPLGSPVSSLCKKPISAQIPIWPGWRINVKTSWGRFSILSKYCNLFIQLTPGFLKHQSPTAGWADFVILPFSGQSYLMNYSLR